MRNRSVPEDPEALVPAEEEPVEGASAEQHGGAPKAPLDALQEALGIALAEMRTKKSQPFIRETRECALALIRHASPHQEDDPLDEVSDEVLIEQLLVITGWAWLTKLSASAPPARSHEARHDASDG
jgi:hypothetical protein